MVRLIYIIAGSIIFFTGVTFASCNITIEAGLIKPQVDCTKAQDQSIGHLLQLLGLIIALKTRIDDDTH